jgi:hypothetical protein
MNDVARAAAELARAERDIADAEHRVGAQALRVAKLREDGHPTASAEKLLEAMRQITALLHDRRDLILKEIAHSAGQNSESNNRLNLLTMAR